MYLQSNDAVFVLEIMQLIHNNDESAESVIHTDCHEHDLVKQPDNGRPSLSNKSSV